MKTFKKLILWVIIVFVSVIIIGAAAVALFLPKEKIKSMALEKISSALQRDVAIDDISVSFWGGLGVQLEGIKISNPKGFERNRFLEAEGLDIKLRIWPLLRKEIQVDKLILLKPKITLLKTSEGKSNYVFGAIDSLAPAAVDKLPEESGLAIAIISFDNFNIKNGLIEYADDSSQTAFSIYGLSLQTSLSTLDKNVYQLIGEFGSDSVLIKEAGKDGLKIPVMTIASSYKIKVDLDKSQAVLSDSKLEINGWKFAVNAGIPNFKTFNFVNLEIDSEKKNLSEILAMVPANYKTKLSQYNISGEMEFEAALKYNGTAKETMQYSGKANISNLKLMVMNTKDEISIKKLNIDFRNNFANIVLKEGTVEGNNFEGVAKISDFKNIYIDGSLKGGISLAILNRFLPETGKPEITGEANFDLSGSGRLSDPSGLKIYGDLKIKNGTYKAETLPEPIDNFELDLKIESKKIAINNLSVKSPSSDFSLSGSLTDPFPSLMPWFKGEATKPYLNFALNSQRLNIDILFPEAVPGGAGADLSQMPLDSLPPLPIPDINGNGTAAIDTLIYYRVEFSNIKSNITIGDRKISMNDVIGNAYTGKVTGEMTVDLSNFENPGYAGTFRGEQIEANDFLSRFTGFGGHLFGKVEMSGGFSASGWDAEPILNSLDMKGVADFKEAKLINFDLLNKLAEQLKLKSFKEETIRNLNSKYTVKDGRISFDDFKFASSFGDWDITGSVGFDGSLDYSGTILLSDQLTQNIMSQSGMVSGLAGMLKDSKTNRIRLPFTLGGAYAKPNISLDLTGNKTIQDNIGDAINNLFKKK